MKLAAVTVEPDVVQVIHEIVEPGWVCADVGALVGGITAVLADRVGSTGKVVAIEAHPENAKALQQHVELLGYADRVEIKNLAVTDGSQPQVWLYRGRQSSSYEWNIRGYDVEGNPTGASLQVPAGSLDNLFPRGARLDFVKIDIEGAAGHAFRGMQRLLQDTRPVLLIEFHDEAEWAERKQLLDSQYELWDLQGHRLDPGKDTQRAYHCLAIPCKAVERASEATDVAIPCAGENRSYAKFGLGSETQPHLNTGGCTTRPFCLFVNTYYPSFLRSLYERKPELRALPYRQQLESLLRESFGDSDFYSEGVKQAGWDADNIVVNCSDLQDAWAHEIGISKHGLEVAVEQIERLRPQVTYIQDLGIATSEFLQAIRPHTELIIGQIASGVPPHADLRRIDLIFSSFPHFVERFRQQGLTAYYLPLAFEPRVLRALPQSSRTHSVTFIGGLTKAHGKGTEFLEYLSARVPIDMWGYGVETLRPNSPIRARHHGEVWGLEMFSLFGQSRVTLNRHIDVAENCANNMRLFEATGCGALLMTDYKDNLNDLFEIGKEVVAYRSPEECAALIKYYLAHPGEAETIARAGQERTLRDHTYAGRMARVAEILERHLRYRREAARGVPVDPAKVSYGHQAIAANEVTEDLTLSWKKPEMALRQRSLVQQELQSTFRGKPPLVFRVLSEALRPIAKPGTSILEIGCSSGYYFEVLEYFQNRSIDYFGVDYSEPMIALAQSYYPRAKFKVADGAQMPFAEGQFDIAISSGVLLHAPNYAEHILETARVAKRFVVAHRTPICRQRQTQYFKKLAYGAETVELRFNEAELLRLFLDQGLELVSALEFATNAGADQFDVTYVFKKGSGRRARRKNREARNGERASAGSQPTDRESKSDTANLTMNDLLAFHHLQVTGETAAQISKSLHLLGLHERDLQGKTPEQRAHLAVGEYFAKIAEIAGRIASENLFKAQWELAKPDWFDHRHHLLNPEKHFTDYWTISPDNVLAKLPLNGKLLNLCCGDGFYDFHFYRKRAGEIVGVDINGEALGHAVRLHSSPGIAYLRQDVLAYEGKPNYFDVVCIRGAIEHFSRQDQQKLFHLALKNLKPGGWFCGDTVGNASQGSKIHEAHQFEWQDEEEMRRELEKVFPEAEVSTYTSKDRVTLLWQCQKPG